MIPRKDLNVYFDPSSQGWVCELNTIDGWVVYGTYATPEDAWNMR